MLPANLEVLYLDYVNNFLTAEAYAAYLGLPVADTLALLDICRRNRD